MWIETAPEGEIVNLDTFCRIEKSCEEAKTGEFVGALYGVRSMDRVVLCKTFSYNKDTAEISLDYELERLMDALKDGKQFYSFNDF